MFRKLSLFDDHYTHLSLKVPIPDFHMVTLSETSQLTGRTCADCAFRTYDILLIGLSRDGSIQPQVPPDYEFRIGDILYFLGTTDNFRKLSDDLL